MGEFELIDAIVAELGTASGGPAVVVGPGDDAAVVELPTGQQLVTSVDTLVSDIHFPAMAPPRLIAERALRVSVSDLAAMGATPLGALVALVLSAAVLGPLIWMLRSVDPQTEVAPFLPEQKGSSGCSRVS